jgi:hypothetical protein
VSLRDGSVQRRLPAGTVAFAGDAGFFRRASDTELDLMTAAGTVTAAYHLSGNASVLLPGLPSWR